VLSETALLAVVINRQRPFQFIHGDVVHTPDILGQRFGRLSKRKTSGFEQVAQNLLKLNVVIRSMACVTLL
jgi:hypothetical protein